MIQFLLVLAAATFALLPAAAGADAAAKPLAHRVEAVRVWGRELPGSLRGFPVESYRVFADHGLGLEAIPMQIEERDERGAILMKQGPHPDPSDGALDGRDEVLFMARDAGAPYSGSPPPGCANRARVVLADPGTGAKGGVIVAQCENPPPISPQDYVRLDPKTWTVTTSRYRFGWHEKLVFDYDYITLNGSPDLLDRLRVRLSVGKWGVNYTFNEDQFHYTLLGYNDGPVRVSWKADNYWTLGILGKLPVPQHIVFYDEYLVMQDTMDLSMNPALIGLDMAVEIGHDLSLEASRGYRICANVLAECLPLQGTIPDGSLKQFTEQEIRWGGASGPEGALLIRIQVDPRLKAKVKGKFTFDQSWADPPEYLPGSGPRLSFYLVDWKNVKRELYDLWFYFYFLSRYSPAEFERFEAMLNAPLAVAVE